MSGADSGFAVGTEVRVGEVATTVERRAGTDQRPLVRLAGIDPREHAGASILVDEPLAEGEFLAEQLVGLEVAGLGRVTGIVNGPSCDVLDVEGTLVPFIEDAVTSVDLERRVIEVDRDFLGL